MNSKVVLLAFLIVASASFAEADPSSGVVAFTNANLATMESPEILRGQTLIVRDGKIAAFGNRAEVEIPADAMVIDAGNGVLIPGMHDLHTHVRLEEELPQYLARGVTTIAVLMGSERTLGLRSSVDEGRIDGPTMIIAGRPIEDIEHVDAAKAVVERQSENGFDAIKIYNRISADALKEMTSVARRHGMLSIGHIPRNLTWQQMIGAGPDAIAHAEEFLYSPVIEGDEERIAAAMLESDVSLITCLITYDAIGRQVADLERMFDETAMRYVDPVTRRGWNSARNGYIKRFSSSDVMGLRAKLAFQRSLVKLLHEKGVPILPGTDAGGVPFVLPGTSLHDELTGLVAAGLSPYDALRSATAGAAAFLGRSERTGTIAIGKDADLVLLRGNPLRDIESVKLIGGVMVRGSWFSQSDLRRMLDTVAEVNERESEVLSRLANVPLGTLLAELRAGEVREERLNELAFQYLRLDDDAVSAVQILRANARLHPRSWRAHQSLGEVLLEDERIEDAIASFEKSAHLNPENLDASEALARLRSGKGEPPASNEREVSPSRSR